MRRTSWLTVLFLVVACARTEGACGCCNESYCEDDVAKSCKSHECWSSSDRADPTPAFCMRKHITVSADCPATGQVCRLSHASNSTSPYGVCVDKDAKPCGTEQICMADGQVMECKFTSAGYVTDRKGIWPCPSGTACHPVNWGPGVLPNVECTPTPFIPCDPGGYPLCADTYTLVHCIGNADAGFVEFPIVCGHADAGPDAGPVASYQCKTGGTAKAQCGPP
jgi:hypothetical protein